MKFKSGDYEAVHESPIWRDRSNFIFAAHLGEKEEKMNGSSFGGAEKRTVTVPGFLYVLGFLYPSLSVALR